MTVSDAIFGLEPRTDIIHRCVVWQLAKRQAGTHAVKNRADIHRTGKKMYRQKGTGSARHGSARVNLFRGGGRSFGPHPRSHEIGLPKKVRALALKHALSAKAKDDGIIVIEALELKEAKTKVLRSQFEKLGLSNALIIDGAEVADNVRTAARNIPNIDVLPIAGHQRLRHPAAAKTGADPRRGRCVGGAIQMTTTDPRHYDVILAPVITEKATNASEHNKVIFKVALTRDQAADQGSGREAVRRQGQEREHAAPPRQVEGVSSGRFGLQSNTKRAIVTLEEGQRIDVTTGL